MSGISNSIGENSETLLEKRNVIRVKKGDGVNINGEEGGSVSGNIIKAKRGSQININSNGNGATASATASSDATSELDPMPTHSDNCNIPDRVAPEASATAKAGAVASAPKAAPAAPAEPAAPIESAPVNEGSHFMDWVAANKQALLIAGGIAAAIALLKGLTNTIKYRFQKCVLTLGRMQRDFLMNGKGLDMRAVLPGIGSRIMDHITRIFARGFSSRYDEGAIGVLPFIRSYQKDAERDYKQASDLFNAIKGAEMEGKDFETRKPETHESVGEIKVYNSFKEMFENERLNESEGEPLNEGLAVGAALSLGMLAVRGGMFLFQSLRNGKDGKKEEPKAVSITGQSTKEVCVAVINNFLGKYIDVGRLSKETGVDISSATDMDKGTIDKLAKAVEQFKVDNHKGTMYPRIKEAYNKMLDHYIRIGNGVINNFEKYSRKKVSGGKSDRTLEKNSNLILAGTEKLKASWEKEAEFAKGGFEYILADIVSSEYYTKYVDLILNQYIPMLKTGTAGDSDFLLDVHPKKGEYYLVSQSAVDDGTGRGEGSKRFGNVAIAEVTDFTEGQAPKISFVLRGRFKNDVFAKFDKVNYAPYSEDGSNILGKDDIDFGAYMKSKDADPNEISSYKEYADIPYSKWVSLDPKLIEEDWVGSVFGENQEGENDEESGEKVMFAKQDGNGGTYTIMGDMTGSAESSTRRSPEGPVKFDKDNVINEAPESEGDEKEGEKNKEGEENGDGEDQNNDEKNTNEEQKPFGTITACKIDKDGNVVGKFDVVINDPNSVNYTLDAIKKYSDDNGFKEVSSEDAEKIETTIANSNVEGEKKEPEDNSVTGVNNALDTFFGFGDKKKSEDLKDDVVKKCSNELANEILKAFNGINLSNMVSVGVKNEDGKYESVLSYLKNPSKENPDYKKIKDEIEKKNAADQVTAARTAGAETPDDNASMNASVSQEFKNRIFEDGEEQTKQQDASQQTQQQQNQQQTQQQQTQQQTQQQQTQQNADTQDNNKQNADTTNTPYAPRYIRSFGATDANASSNDSGVYYFDSKSLFLFSSDGTELSNFSIDACPYAEKDGSEVHINSFEEEKSIFENGKGCSIKMHIWVSSKCGGKVVGGSYNKKTGFPLSSDNNSGIFVKNTDASELTESIEEIIKSFDSYIRESGVGYLQEKSAENLNSSYSVSYSDTESIHEGAMLSARYTRTIKFPKRMKLNAHVLTESIWDDGTHINPISVLNENMRNLFKNVRGMNTISSYAKSKSNVTLYKICERKDVTVAAPVNMYGFGTSGNSLYEHVVVILSDNDGNIKNVINLGSMKVGENK